MESKLIESKGLSWEDIPLVVLDSKIIFNITGANVEGLNNTVETMPLPTASGHEVASTQPIDKPTPTEFVSSSTGMFNFSLLFRSSSQA